MWQLGSFACRNPFLLLLLLLLPLHIAGHPVAPALIPPGISAAFFRGNAKAALPDCEKQNQAVKGGGEGGGRKGKEEEKSPNEILNIHKATCIMNCGGGKLNSFATFDWKWGAGRRRGREGVGGVGRRRIISSCVSILSSALISIQCEFIERRILWDSQRLCSPH